MAKRLKIVLQLEVTAPVRLPPERVNKVFRRVLGNRYEASGASKTEKTTTATALT